MFIIPSYNKVDIGTIVVNRGAYRQTVNVGYHHVNNPINLNFIFTFEKGEFYVNDDVILPTISFVHGETLENYNWVFENVDQRDLEYDKLIRYLENQSQ